MTEEVTDTDPDRLKAKKIAQENFLTENFAQANFVNFTQRNWL